MCTTHFSAPTFRFFSFKVLEVQIPACGLGNYIPQSLIAKIPNRPHCLILACEIHETFDHTSRFRQVVLDKRIKYLES